VQSRLIAAGRPLAAGDPLNVPIVPVSTYELGSARGYARAHGTPTWQAMEDVVGEIEQGVAVSFASGMAAVSAVLEQVPLQGRVAAPTGCYLGTAALLTAGEERGRWSVTWLAPTDTAAWRAAAEDHDMLWLESPTNPLLEVMDVPSIAETARAAGTTTAMDNTFATPLAQQPLRLGVDLVVHSATKYLGGHSDLLAGVVVAGEETAAAAIRDHRTLTGATVGALEAFLTTRGLRTLALRVQAASSNAALLAGRLVDHPAVRHLRYPGLAADPGHEVAAGFMTGFGAMVSFEVAGGAAAADWLCRSVTLIRHATSLGGVESTLERRGALQGQEHLPPGLVRLSVGCESGEDLWRDLRSALDATGV